jgi:hypothetical protein
MFHRKITFARVRRLVLTCVILIGVFGQIGVAPTAECFNCAGAVCPGGPGPCGPPPNGVPQACTCIGGNGTLTKCFRFE